MKTITLTALFAAVAAPTPVQAESRSFGEHGGYDVFGRESRTAQDLGFCAMNEEDFEGPGETHLSILRTLDHPDKVLVIVDNANWSAKKGQEYKLTIRTPEWEWERDAVGTSSGYRHGFSMAFAYDDFMPALAKATYLHFYVGETVVDRLSMEGSAAAKVALERCWAWLKADHAAKVREWNRWNHIPKDPFATAPSPKKEQ